MRSPARRATIALVLVAAVLGGASAAFGWNPLGSGDDPRTGIEPVPAAVADGTRESFAVETIATGLNRPTFAGAAPGEPGVIWVLEQPGRVVRLDGDRRSEVIDLGDKVKLGAEQGLLGIAFHPDFARNGRLFLHHSDKAGDTRVVELAYDRERGTARETRDLLQVEQPEENHNGGTLAFGPDGRLHIGLGDGGGAWDPNETAQDLDSRLGKILAADVDGGGAKPEWEPILYGLRNPWRFWFDGALGEIWIADVGQDTIEEINRTLLEPDEPPKNFGWSAFEGGDLTEKTHATKGPGELIWPVVTYEHGEDGCSVTGGFVYRGRALTELSGRYLYGDFCSGRLWSLKPAPDGSVRDVKRETATAPQVTHIGTDSDGEPLLALASGEILRAVPKTGREA